MKWALVIHALDVATRLGLGRFVFVSAILIPPPHRAGGSEDEFAEQASNHLLRMTNRPRHDPRASSVPRPALTGG